MIVLPRFARRTGYHLAQRWRKRLAALRRRLRFVVTVRGVGWMLALVLLTVATVGAVDWAWHLSALSRAIVLVCTMPARTVIEEIVMSPTFQRDTSRDVAAAYAAGAPPSVS